MFTRYGMSGHAVSSNPHSPYYWKYYDPFTTKNRLVRVHNTHPITVRTNPVSGSSVANEPQNQYNLNPPSHGISHHPHKGTPTGIVGESINSSGTVGTTYSINKGTSLGYSTNGNLSVSNSVGDGFSAQAGTQSSGMTKSIGGGASINAGISYNSGPSLGIKLPLGHSGYDISAGIGLNGTPTVGISTSHPGLIKDVLNVVAIGSAVGSIVDIFA